MIDFPEIRPNLRVELIEGGVCLIDESGVRVYSDIRYRKVIELIASRISSDEISQVLRDSIPSPEVFYIIMELEDRGYIIDRDSFVERNFVDECSLLSGKPAAFRSKVNSLHIVVDNLTDRVGLEHSFVDALQSAGFHAGVEPTISQACRTVRVAIVEDYLSNHIDTYKELRNDDKVDWLLVKPTGTTVWLGPIFGKDASVCWECLATRLKTNRISETLLSNFLPSAAFPPTTLLRPVEEAAKGFIISYLTTKYAQGSDGTNPAIQEIDLGRFATTRHSVVPLDTCPVCRPVDIEAAAAGSPKLTSRRIAFSSDGGYRSINPSQTLHLEQQLVSVHTGIISTLVPIGGESDNIHVYLARHNYGYRPTSTLSEATNLINTSAGKGRTADQAKASALCEAVERHSIFLQGNEHVISDSFSNMAGDAIDPNDCMLFSDAQFRNRDLQPRGAARTLKIPEPLNSFEIIDWSPVWSLTQQREKYLPTAYLYHTPGGTAHPKGSNFAVSDSNGNAAGNNLEEAILQGFLELVERDATAIWWYNKLNAPKVNLAALRDPYIASLVETYSAAGRSIWVLDITNDLGVPTFVAISRIDAGEKDDILIGFGAHLNGRIGISRALTELNQMLPRARQAKADPNKLDGETRDWFRLVSLETAPFLAGSRDQSSFSEAVVGAKTGDILDEIDFCRKLIEKNGMEFIIHDQTRRETGLNSVKVIVPGLRHYWVRLAPGRLYDVPTKLGLLSRANAEEEMNSIAIL